MRKPKEKGSFLRTCIGCHGRFDKRILLRIAKTADGKVFIDQTGTGQGRGAYICKDKGCFEKMKKQRRLSKLLKGDVAAEIYAETEALFDRK